MADAKNEDEEAIVLERADEAVVAYAVTPQLPQRTLERFADLARIIEPFDSFVQKLQDEAGDRLVEVVGFFLSRRIELNRPLLV